MNAIDKSTVIRQHDRPEQSPPAGYKWTVRVVELPGDDVRNFRSEWYLVSTSEAAEQRSLEMESQIPAKITAAKSTVKIVNPENVSFIEAKALLENSGCRNVDGIAQHAFRDGHTVTLSQLEVSIKKNLIANAKRGR